MGRSIFEKNRPFAQILSKRHVTLHGDFGHSGNFFSHTVLPGDVIDAFKFDKRAVHIKCDKTEIFDAQTVGKTVDIKSQLLSLGH